MATLPSLSGATAPGRPPLAPSGASSKHVQYPESDGEPMGESAWHVQVLVYLLSVLQQYFASVPDVCVMADMFLYYEEGTPSAKVAPDIMVIRGVDKRERPSYFLWEERQAPCCVIEITSASSRLDDMGTKRALYAMLGVPEYFVFDPLGEYLRPPLVRFRLSDNGDYAREDGTELESRELGLRFRVEGTRLRAIDPVTGEPLLDLAESEQARRAAEEEIARLRAELEQSRQQQ